jgi:hypothetical protein
MVRPRKTDPRDSLPVFQALMLERWEACQELMRASDLIRVLIQLRLPIYGPDSQRLSIAVARWDDVNTRWKEWNNPTVRRAKAA